MRPITLLVAILAVAPFNSVATQERPSVVRPGTRVRVSIGGVSEDELVMVARVARLTRDTLFIRGQASGSSLFPIPVDQISLLQVSRGRDDRPVLIGAVIGAVAGAAIGFAVAPDPECPLLDFECEVRPKAGGFVVGAVLGTVAGGLMGKAARGDRWEEVPLDQLRVSITPHRDGRFGLGLSVRF